MDDIFLQAKKAAEHLSGLCRVDCRLALQRAPRSAEFIAGEARFCEGCSKAGCDMVNTCLYGCSEAYRWDGRYIYYCPMGLVFAAASIVDERGLFLGGVTAGPVVMGEPDDTLCEVSDPAQAKRVAALPVMSTSRVNHLAEVLAALTEDACRIPGGDPGQMEYPEDGILSLCEIKSKRIDEADTGFFIKAEKQLTELVKCGDRDEATKLLNGMLNYIYFSHDFSPADIKARVTELIVLLSRAAIESGADADEIFASNTDYIKSIEGFRNIEELSIWLTVAVHRFINYLFDFESVRHSDVIYKAIDYIHRNYADKITLDSVASHVHFSRSYLSSLFKSETGKSLFEYINDFRIEKSEELLRDGGVKLVDIAGLCGFEDQSYFTKVFKKTVGVSPKKYRDNNLGG